MSYAEPEYQPDESSSELTVEEINEVKEIQQALMEGQEDFAKWKRDTNGCSPDLQVNFKATLRKELLDKFKFLQLIYVNGGSLPASQFAEAVIRHGIEAVFAQVSVSALAQLQQISLLQDLPEDIQRQVTTKRVREALAMLKKSQLIDLE